MNIESLIKCNTNLIYKIAQSFYGVPKEDLFQAGVLGILKAYKNYKKDGEVKFSSYAYDYIYGEMYTLVNNKTIKVNKDILKLYKMIEKTRYTLAQKYNRVPSNKEIAMFLEIPEKNINDAILAGKEIMSLDNDKLPLIDIIKIEEKTSLDDKILLSEGLEILSDDERKIIKARYYEDLTQSQVARKLSMTQVMVSRYEKKGLSKMQAYLNV